MNRKKKKKNYSVNNELMHQIIELIKPLVQCTKYIRQPNNAPKEKEEKSFCDSRQLIQFIDNPCIITSFKMSYGEKIQSRVAFV